MPVLKTYTAPPPQLTISGGRRAEGSDFGPDYAQIGASVKKSAEGYLDFTEENEARQALIATSQIRAEYARRLDEAQISGGDLGKLKEEMSSKMAKVGENFQTKRGADSLALYTSNNELMFDEQANRIAVHRAASQAKIDGSSFMKNESATIRSNPLYLPLAEKNAEALGETFSRIPTWQRAEIVDGLKKELNMAAAVGSARVDPEGTKKKLENGQWDLTPAQREHAVNLADTEIRAKRSDEIYQRNLKEYQERERDEAARDKHFKGIMAGTSGRRAIMDDPELKPTTREHLIVFMEHRAKAFAGQERKSDQTVVRDLWLRINAPDNDPRKIYTGDAIFAAVNNGKVNVSDANGLNTLVANQKDENGRAFGSRLRERMIVLGRAMNDSPEYKNQPELSSAIQMNLVAQVEKKASELRKKGESPDALLDPDSKDFFFKSGILKATAAAVKNQTVLDTVPRPKSQAEYDALPAGTVYVDTDGAQKTKKGKQVVSGKITAPPAGNISDVTAP